MTVSEIGELIRRVVGAGLGIGCRKRSGRRSLLALCLLAAVLASGCGSSADSAQTNARRSGIVVGSFNFPESVLLADIYAGALRASGYLVSVERNAGPREIVDPALAHGLVDLVPEYSGSALLFFGLGTVRAGPDTESTHQGLAKVLAARGLVPLSSAPAQDANAIVVTQQTATRYGLRTVSDLASSARQFMFGGPPECPHRSLCLQGLESVYGLRLQEFAPLDTAGPLTVQALLAGEIDVGVLFTTDPAIAAHHLVVLTDDRGLQPAENVTPVLRRTVLARYGPALEALIDRVSARLGTEVVTTLNARMASGEDSRAIAAQWLALQEIT